MLIYFVSTLTDRTLTIDNLCDVLEDVHNLNDLGLYLHVPNSKRSKKELQNHRSLLKHWMKSHPFPSWQLVGEALFRMEESAVLKKVQKKYLIGMWMYVATVQNGLYTILMCSSEKEHPPPHLVQFPVYTIGSNQCAPVCV